MSLLERPGINLNWGGTPEREVFRFNLHSGRRPAEMARAYSQNFRYRAIDAVVGEGGVEGRPRPVLGSPSLPPSSESSGSSATDSNAERAAVDRRARSNDLSALRAALAWIRVRGLVWNRNTSGSPSRNDQTERTSQ